MLLKPINRPVFVFMVLFFTTHLLAAHSNSSRHPHLILTNEGINQLKTDIKTTHHRLWELTVELADQFSDEPVPVFKSANNRYRYIGDTMPVLGLVYRLTGDQKYLTAAETWVQALLDVPEWKGSQNLGRSAWMTGCALLYDWLYNEFDEEFKSQIKKKLIEESAYILKHNSSSRALSNHLLIETCALGLTGLLFEENDQNHGRFLSQADAWVQYIIDHAPPDGSWGEGIQYWQYGTGYFLRFLEAARSSGYKDYYPEYDWLEENGFFPIYFSLPGRLTHVLNFSDCGSVRYIPSFLLYSPASLYKNPYFQDFGIRIQKDTKHKFIWLDLLFYNPLIPRNDIFTLPTFKHFYDHGFVSMRSGWSDDATIIGFRCGPAPGHRNQSDPDRIKNHGFGPGHQHPDINSFCIFSKGEWLAIDPGYTRLKETRNHNTLIVNGYGQAGEGEKWLDYMAFESREPVPEIRRAESTPVYDYILGDAGNIYVDEAGLDHFRRHVLFLKPDIVIIADDLKAKKNSRFDWLLQARDKISAVGSDQYEIVRNNVRLLVIPLLPESVKAEIQTRKIDASDVKGESDIDNGLLKTLNLNIDSVAAVRFLVVLCIDGEENSPSPKVSFQGNLLDISHHGKNWIIDYHAEEVGTDKPLLTVKSPRVSEFSYKYEKKN